MKQIWPNYSYSPTTNVLTLTGLNIDRDQLLLVSAPERGRIMYNFADSTVTASAFTAGANTGLTLVASTAGLTTTAALVIYYDDQVAGISGTVTANVTTLAFTTQGGIASSNDGSIPTYGIQLGYNSDGEYNLVDTINGYPIRGTVAVMGLDTNEDQRQIAVTTSGSVLASISGTVTVGNSVTIGSLPAIFADPSGFESVVAGISDVEVNTIRSVLWIPQENGSDGQMLSQLNPLPISGTVTIGSALPAGTNSIGVVTIGGGTVTIGAGTAQIGSVTASLAISSTAITSGSFTSLTSATLVPGNTARKMATVYNLGAGQLFVNAGATATTLGGGFMVALSSGDFYECDYTTTTLSAIFATAGTASWVSH